MSRFNEVVHDLLARGVMPKTAPGLEKTSKALARLELHYPKDLTRVIVVAGTNGKGSTCKALETLLQAAGRRVGLYTSPHLVSVRERIRINGRDLSEDEFIHAYDSVLARTEDLQLTHFEMLTVMAAWSFFSEEALVDEAIFEVGLGGTWDSTNAIPHKASLICRLGFDHTELLGTTLEEIAANKFGIVGDDDIVIHQPLPAILDQLKTEVQLRTKSQWFAAPEFSTRVDTLERIPKFSLESQWGMAEISLPGERGAENVNLALQAFEKLGYKPSAYLHCLKDIVWPARMQRIDPKGCAFATGIDSPCPVFVSGDHNEQGVESLLDLLKYYRYQTLHFVVGIGARKDADRILHLLSEDQRAKLYLTTTSFQGRSREQYGRWLERAELYNDDSELVLRQACERAGADDLVVVTGSLYLAGDILSTLSHLKQSST